MKRALVTGGAGFLGSHLVDRLVIDGRQVIVVDDLSTGSRDNLAHLAERVDLREWDVLEVGNYRLPVDEIYHLACPASPPAYQRDPIKTLRTCFEGTRAVLELALRNEARVVLASTSEVYGDPDVGPQPESYRGSVNSYGPRAMYDEGKRVMEALAWSYEQDRGAQVAIARIFNSYGPRMAPDDGRVVSNFVVQALRGEPITVYGDGSQTRSLCYAMDTVDGLVRLMAYGVGAGPVNIGNPDERTVLDIARTIAGLAGSSSPIVLRPLPVDDPRRRCPDISRARRLLGWEPTVSVESGLRETVEWFRARGIKAPAGAA